MATADCVDFTDPQAHVRSFAYWTQLFASSAPVLTLPPNFSMVSSVASFTTSHIVELPFSCFELDCMMSQDFDVSRPCMECTNARLSVCLSAFLLIMYRRSHLTDLVVATRVMTTTSVSNSDVALVRVAMDGGDGGDVVSFTQLLSRVRGAVQGAAQNLACKFSTVLPRLLERDHASSAPSDMSSLTSLELKFSTDLMSTDFAETDQNDKDLAQMSISVQVQPSKTHPGFLALQARYNAHLYTEATIIELLGQMRLVLETAMKHKDLSLLLYPLITPSARLILPDPHSNMHLNYGWPGAITTCFDRRAMERGNAIALQSENEYGKLKLISYRDLRLMSDQLALALLKHGVGVGSVVGIYASRCVSLAVAIMGVLKCGAAYSMMDPKYPTERIIACMEVAKPVAWITMSEAGIVWGFGLI